MKRQTAEQISLAILATVVITVAMSQWPIRSYFEAQAYNRVTGESVSTWDAMWIELRVQAGPNAAAGAR